MYHVSCTPSHLSSLRNRILPPLFFFLFSENGRTVKFLHKRSLKWGGIRLLGVYYYYYDLFLLLFLLSIGSSQVLIVNGYITHQEFSLLVLLTSLSFSHSPFSPAMRCDWLVCVYDTARRGMEGPGAGGSI